MLFSSFRLPQPGLLNLTGLSQVHSTTSDSGGKHQAELIVGYEPHAFAPFRFEAPKSHVPTRIWMDDYGDTTSDAGTMRVLFLFEPNVVTHIANKICENPNRWDYILSHNRRVLLRCPNAIRFLHGTTWIQDYSFPSKEFGISHLVSSVNCTNGHNLRRKIWDRRDAIKIPRRFYLSKRTTEYEPEGYLLGDSKDPLYETQFHFAIENCRTKNYFTEKLIDCFQTRTVPIYYGAKNVRRWFNPRGMIIVRDADEAIAACNRLTPDTYEAMKDAIEDNYQRSFQWLEVNQRLQSVISELSSLWPKRQRYGYIARRLRDLA